MKTLQESIIGRKGTGYFRGKLLSNPKITDLKHLDVLKTRDGRCYICLDYKQCPPAIRRQMINQVTLEAYTIPERRRPGDIWSLGLYQVDKYDMNLQNREYPDDDIIEVYRGVLDNANYDSFRDLWGDLQNKLVMK